MDAFKPFKDLFIGHQLEELIDKFRNPSDDEAFILGAEYIIELDSRKYENENPDDDSPRYVRFVDRLEVVLQKAMGSIKKNIDELEAIKMTSPETYKIAREASKINFSHVYASLNDQRVMVYQQRIVLFVVETEAIYNNWYGLNRIQPRVQSSSFDFRYDKYKSEIIEHLASLSLNGKPILKSSIPEFKEILLSDSPSKVDGHIIFQCKTKEAVFLLNLMQEIFFNLSSVSVEKSQKFRTNRGSLLKSGNFRRNKAELGQVDAKPIQKFFRDAIKEFTLKP